MEASNVISNYEYELESMKRRMGGLEAKAQEANDLNDKVYQYEMKIREMNSKIVGLQRDQDMADHVQQENEMLKRKVNELGSINNDYEFKVENITKEIERLNVIVEGKNRDLRDLQMKAEEGENLARQFNQVREDFRKITG